MTDQADPTSRSGEPNIAAPPPPSDGAAALTAIAAFNRGRDAALVGRKYAAMRRGPFAFMRGTCHLFAAEWPELDVLDRAPYVWLSGDLHAENFGTYRGDNRLPYFDVTDFDETARGPLTWDLGRFVASLLVGMAEAGAAADEAIALAHRALVAYRAELRHARPAWLEREAARGLAKRLFTQLGGRSRTELLDRYSTRRGKRRRLLTDGRHLIVAAEDEAALLTAIMQQVSDRSGDPDYFRPVDAARRVAGLGSIGLPRYLVLVEGRGSPDRNVLLDVKPAHPSVIAWRLPGEQPGWEDDATRVATVQRHAVVVPPAFLQSTSVGSESYVVRELQPSDDRVRLKDWERHPRKVAEAVVMMAGVAAWMHLRGAAWRGSDPAERLADFAADDGWVAPLLDAARDAADRTTRAYAAFVAAYDAGALGAAPGSTPPA